MDRFTKHVYRPTGDIDPKWMNYSPGHVYRPTGDINPAFEGWVGNHEYRKTGDINPELLKKRTHEKRVTGDIDLEKVSTAMSASDSPYKKVRTYVPVSNFRITKKGVLIAAEIAGVIIAAVVLKQTWDRVKSPEAVVKNYFTEIVNGDYESAYANTNIGDSNDFINIDSFGKAVEQRWNRAELAEITDIDTYEESYGSSSYRTSRGFNLFTAGRGSRYSGYGDSDEDAMEYADAKTVYVVYKLTDTDGYPLSNQVSMELISTDHGWKVDTSDYIAQNYSLYVKEGASAAVDGIELTGDNTITFAEEGDEVYQIPEIFAGAHDISVSCDGYKTINEASNISSGQSYYAVDMKLSDERVGELEDRAADAFSKIYQAAIAGKNFSEIKDLFTSDADDLENLEYNYENLTSYYNNKNETMNSLKFTDITCSQGYSDLDFTVNFSYSSYGYYQGFGSTRNFNEKGDTSSNFSFTEEDGKYVITSMSLPHVGLY